jgi:hypothetical protein
MLITHECTTFHENLHYDTQKNETPFCFTITLLCIKSLLQKYVSTHGGKIKDKFRFEEDEQIFF